MGVQEVDPLIRNPTRIEGILVIEESAGIDTNTWVQRATPLIRILIRV